MGSVSGTGEPYGGKQEPPLPWGPLATRGQACGQLCMSPSSTFWLFTFWPLKEAKWALGTSPQPKTGVGEEARAWV